MGKLHHLFLPSGQVSFTSHPLNQRVPMFLCNLFAIQSETECCPTTFHKSHDDKVSSVSVGPLVDSCRARRLAHDDDVSWRATKGGDVVAEPLDSEALI